MKLESIKGEYDADLDVQPGGDPGDDFCIVLHSRGGGLNTDYAQTLELLLLALATGGCKIARIEVDSPGARRLPQPERTLPLPYPLVLKPESELDEVRKTICRLQRPIAQQPSVKGGNTTKRIRIHVDSSGAIDAASFAAGVQPVDGRLRRKAFFATWNPDVWNDWDTREADIRDTERGRRVTARWSSGSRKGGIRAGDLIFLLRQGKHSRGLIGVGHALPLEAGTDECVYRDAHYVPDRADRGEEANYVGISWQYLWADENRVPVEDLIATITGVDWNNIQASGQQLPPGATRDLIATVHQHVKANALDAPEVQQVLAVVETAAGRSRGGQGFGLTTAQRLAVEQWAMDTAREYLKQQGCTQIKDTSKNRPYDFHCVQRDGSDLCVEVKGTTSGGEMIILTRNEVAHHKRVYPGNALIVVHSIRLTGSNKTEAQGGVLQLVQPWLIDDEALQTIGYTYQTNGLFNSAP